MLGVTILVILIALSPMLRAVISASARNGYFEGNRCACGLNSFIYIKGDEYYTYAPGHNVQEHLAFKLRVHDDKWEKLALAPPHGATAFVEEGQVVGRLRIEGGNLYESFGGTNWVRHARVYNPYRVWIAQLLTP